MAGTWSKHAVAWALGVALMPGLVGHGAPAAPQSLTEANYAEVRRHVELRPGDLNFQQVDWRSSVYDGVAQAQREDKPLVLWLYFGDPRGGC